MKKLFSAILNWKVLAVVAVVIVVIFKSKTIKDNLTAMVDKIPGLPTAG